MLKRNTQWIGSIVLAGCVGGLIGCDLMFPTMGDVKNFAALEAERLDAHDKNVTEQHKLQTPELADKLDALRGEYTTSSKDIDGRMKALESSLQPLIEAGLTGGIAFIGKLAGIDIPLADMFATRDDADGAQDGKITEVSAKVGDLVKTVAELERRLKKEISDTADDAEEDAARIQERLAQLDEKTREKFAGVTESQFEKLEALKDDDAAFRRELQQQLDLTDDQMGQLADMSPTEILALIAAAGGGGALSRLGRSRGADDTAKARRESREAKDAVARLEAAAAAKPGN